MRSIAGVLAVAALVTVISAGTVAIAAGAAEPPRIFIATGDDYVVALKLEDGKAWVLAVAAKAHCAVTAEEEGASDTEFLEGYRAPKPLRPSEMGLRAIALEGGLWESDWSAVAQVMLGTTVAGVFEAHHSGEGEPNCHAGELSESGYRVPFEAVEYVPVTDPRAGEPVPGEVPFYYAQTPGLEVYMWRPTGYVAGIRGAASSLRCSGPLPIRSLRRRLSLYSRPSSAKLVGDRSFRLDDGPVNELGKDPPFKESRVLTGTLTRDTITGTFRRREVGRTDRGKWSCELPRTSYEAVRYVPAASPPPA